MALGGARAMATYVQSDGMRHTFVSDVVSTSACVQLVACPGAAHAKNRARMVVKRCHLIAFMSVVWCVPGTNAYVIRKWASVVGIPGTCKLAG